MLAGLLRWQHRSSLHQTAAFSMRPLLLVSMLASCASRESNVHEQRSPSCQRHREHCKTDGPNGESLAAGVAVGRLYNRKNTCGQGLRVVGPRAAAADSIGQMAPVGDAVDLVDPAKLRRRLDGAAGAVVDAYRATHGEEELKLTFRGVVGAMERRRSRRTRPRYHLFHQSPCASRRGARARERRGEGLGAGLGAGAASRRCNRRPTRRSMNCSCRMRERYWRGRRRIFMLSSMVRW